MREFCEQSLADTILWCNEVSKKGDVEMVIRPRPSTTLDVFLEAIDRILPEITERLHIIQEESVREWILASDVVVSSYSTSLIEAAIAGKAVYMVEPYPIPDPLRAKWHDLLPHIKTGKEFSKACSLTAAQGTGYRLNQWARKSMMAHGDSIRRLADYLVQLHEEKISFPRALPWEVVSPDVKNRWFTWLRLPYRRIKRLLFQRKIVNIPLDYVNDVKDEAEIRLRIQKWADLISVSNQD